MSDTASILEEPIEPEVIPEDAVIKRQQLVPENVNELAALKEDGHEIIEARVKILQTLRLASILATNPEDWVLFRAVDKQSNQERITAYLQDSGCGRIRPLWGIEITPPKGQKDFPFERTSIGEEFAYTITGDGECRITGQIIRGMTGTRYSTDDDAKYIQDSIRKEMRVKSNARVNLDGNITRNLAGMKTVPIDELDRAWDGTKKSSKKCAWGRGFKDLMGAETGQSKDAPQVAAPICEMDGCGRTMEYHPGGTYQGRPYDPYYRCPLYKWDNSARKSNGHSRMPAAKWIESQSKQSREPGEEG